MSRTSVDGSSLRTACFVGSLVILVVSLIALVLGLLNGGGVPIIALAALVCVLIYAASGAWKRPSHARDA